jgi:hypothetical protein
MTCTGHSFLRRGFVKAKTGIKKFQPAVMAVHIFICLNSELWSATENLFACGGDVRTLTLLSWKDDIGAGEGGLGFMGARGACGGEEGAMRMKMECR